MIAAVVPAAGRSERMGRPKLLLTLDGETIIHRVVRALLHGGAERVIVVAPSADAPEGPLIAAEAERAGAGFVVPDVRPAEMRRSFELGLARLEAEFDPARPTRSLLLTPGDAPALSAEAVARVCAAARAWPDRIIVPCHEGRRGHPIALPWNIALEVRALPENAGVNALVARCSGRTTEISAAGPEILVDLDTPDDWRRWAGEPQDGRDDQGNHLISQNK